MRGHRGSHRHPVNVALVDKATLGEQIADRAAAAIGSWRFLVVQTIAVVCWLALNIVGFVRHWDVYPFVLLNLLFSVQAAYTGPVLLLAGNRQAQKDRLTLEHDYTATMDILAELKHNTELTIAVHGLLSPDGNANRPP